MANIRNNIGTPAPAGPGESAQAVRERWAGEIGPAAPMPDTTWNEAWAGLQDAPPMGPQQGGAFVSRNGQMTSINGLEMQNNVPSEVITSPTTVNEAYIGSLKAMLIRNKGNYIVATFLIGVQNTISWEGILYDVSNDYVTIYQEPRDRYIVCDIYSLKYMEFYDIRRRELCNQLLSQQGQNQW